MEIQVVKYSSIVHGVQTHFLKCVEYHHILCYLADGTILWKHSMEQIDGTISWNHLLANFWNLYVFQTFGKLYVLKKLELFYGSILWNNFMV